jgi:hypothetical protein
MAAKLNPRHSQMVRDKIQASKLIEVLQDHAMGISEEIKPSRLKAIEILLKKSVPDLSSVELSGDPDAPVVHKVITGVPND